MTGGSKWREFWIASNGPYDDFISEMRIDDCTHVIEYGAVTELEAELAKQKEFRIAMAKVMDDEAEKLRRAEVALVAITISSSRDDASYIAANTLADIRGEK